MTSTYQAARKHEKEGNLTAAAKLYTESGFRSVNDADFESCTRFRVGIAILIKASSAAVRAGNDRRGEVLRDIITELLDRTISEADGDDEVVIGLYYEWIGDVHFLTRSERAEYYYRKALEYYEDKPEMAFLSWSMEQESDYERWAIEAYLESEGVEAELPVSDFTARITDKIGYLDRLRC